LLLLPFRRNRQGYLWHREGGEGYFIHPQELRLRQELRQRQKLRQPEKKKRKINGG
jgi:hypothetical protein